MTTSRPSELLRGAGALVLLALLVVGVPAALATMVGWPLPTRVPSLSEVEAALTTTGVSDRTIVKALAVVVWVAWLQLAAAVAVEVVRTVRGRPPADPAPGAVRRLAATLVASVGLLGSAVVMPRSVVPSLSALAAASAAPAGVTPVLASPARPAVAPPVPPDAAPARTWTVGPRDTLWGIAEQVLGSGARWHEIHRANIGRTVAPGVVYRDDTDGLRAGWVLALPGPADPAPGGGPHAVVVQPGDSLSRLARRHYGDPDAWPVLWEANRGRRFGDRRFDDPNLILVGWDLVVPPIDPGGAGPGTARPAASSPPVAGAPLDAGAVTPLTGDLLDAGRPAPGAVGATGGVEAPGGVGVIGGDVAPADAVPIEGVPGDAVPADAVPIDAVAGDSVPTEAAAGEAGAPPGGAGVGTGAALAARDAAPPVPARAPEAPGRPAWVLPTGVAGATLLAAGVAGLLGSKRQQRLRATRPGQRLPANDPALAPVEAAIQRAADLGTVARLEVVLRALAAMAGRLERPVRPLAVLHHGDGDVEVVLDRPASLPAPWRGSGTRWSVPSSVPLADLVREAAGVGFPCPALVELGCSGDTAVLVDLEAVGILAVHGAPLLAAAMARAVMASLGAAPFGVPVEVVAVGAEAASLGGGRVHRVDDGDTAVEQAAVLTAGLHPAVDESGSTFALRAARPEEAWEPVVVVAAAPVGAAAQRQLRDLVGPGGRGVAVLTDQPELGARWCLEATDDGLVVLQPLGIELAPHGLDAGELAALAALVAEAERPPLDEPAPALDAGPPDPAAGSLDWAVLVRLLGPPDVVDASGTEAAFERSKSLELVVWLAVHRERATRDAARAALWETDVRDASFANVVSDARRTLARLVAPPEGEEWIGRTYGSALPLHPLVRTDADLVEAAVRRARGLGGAEAVAVLRHALDLVRGEPFEGTMYLWPDATAVPSSLVVLVTGAAGELARRCLDLGDADGAFWATSQGLRVLPGHEELVCLRMEAHALRGDRAGVKAEYDAYERVILADAWGDQQPATKVVATRTRLLRETTGAVG